MVQLLPAAVALMLHLPLPLLKPGQLLLPPVWHLSQQWLLHHLLCLRRSIVRQHWRLKLLQSCRRCRLRRHCTA